MTTLTDVVRMTQQYFLDLDVSNDSLDDDSSDVSPTDTSTTVNGSTKAEINLQTLIPEEMDTKNLTDLLDLDLNDDI